MANSEQEEFLRDLIVEKDDVFDAPLEVPAKETVEEEEKGDGFEPKNRREKRLLVQNQRLREEAIAERARAEGIADAQRRVAESETSEFRNLVSPIFGDNTAEKAAATDLFEAALKRVYEKSKEDAVAEVETRTSRGSQAIRSEEQKLDDMVDEVEDEFGRDLSPEDKRGFYSLLDRLSPKDEDGDIIEYADPITTYELYEARKGRASNRAKETASRSMTRSGASQPSKLEDDANWRAVKDIIG